MRVSTVTEGGDGLALASPLIVPKSIRCSLAVRLSHRMSNWGQTPMLFLMRFIEEGCATVCPSTSALPGVRLRVESALCVRESVCVRERVCVCVCVCERERERVAADTWYPRQHLAMHTCQLSVVSREPRCPRILRPHNHTGVSHTLVESVSVVFFKWLEYIRTRQLSNINKMAYKRKRSNSRRECDERGSRA